MPVTRPRARFPTALTLLFLLCVGLIGIGAVALVLASNALIASTRALETDLDVKRGLESLLVALVDAEAGQRGFLLTGQPEFLQPYVEAVARQAYTLGDLERLTAGDPHQRDAVLALKAMVDQGLRELSVTSVDGAGRRIAPDLESITRAAQAMGRARTAIQRLRSDEDVLLVQHRADVEARIRYGFIVLLAANAATLVGIAALFAAMRGYHRSRQRKDEGLAQQEEVYRTLFEASPLGEAACDPQTSRFLRGNAKLCEITGHPPDGLRRTTVIDLLPRANRLDNARAYRDLVAGKQDVLRLEQPLRRADGSTTWVEIHLGAVRGAGGAVVQVDAIVQDITARQHAEAVRNRALAVLRAIGEGNRNLVYAKDTQGRYVFANAALAGALERDETEILGARDEDLFPPECAAALRAAHRLVLDTRMPQTTEQVLRFARETRTYLLSASPLLDEMTEVAGAVAIGTDITESKGEAAALRASLDRSEDRFAHASILARQAVEEERRRVALDLHDELGAAFSAVWVDLVGVLTQLRKLQPQLTLRQERALAALTQASESVRRITAGLHPVLLEQAGLAAALGRHVSEWSITTGIRADFHADDALPALSRDEELALFRVAQEALTNVHKYAGATHVTLHLSSTKDGVRLAIRDDGVGIDADPASAFRDGAARPEGGTSPGAANGDYDGGTHPGGGETAGHGIAGMRARLQPLGGTLWVARRGDAGGTEVTVRLPIIPGRP